MLRVRIDTDTVENMMGSRAGVDGKNISNFGAWDGMVAAIGLT